MTNLTARLRASGIHLGISAAVAAIAALVVFMVWYPYPYRVLSGGRDLFAILMAVDVVVGPLITLAVFNLAKPRSELRRDLMIVAALQAGALAYGLWTVALARPVHLVFEIDRFRAVHAVEVDKQLEGLTPKDVVALPWTGPTVLSLRPFRDAAERTDATIAALQGVPLGVRPDLWRSYDAGRNEVIAAARPITQLHDRLPAEAQRIKAVILDLGLDAATVAYVPMASRRGFWTVLVDSRTAAILGYLPIDSF